MTTYYDYLGNPVAQSATSQTVVYGDGGDHETLYAVPGPSAISSEGGKYDTLVDNVNGDVTFYAKDPTDTVVVANGLTGVDTIVAYSAYVLPANVQNLYFSGGDAWGIGNSLNNLIVMQGNDANVMDGGAGNDVLVGGFGQNNIQEAVGAGNDVIYNFHTAIDTVRLIGASFTTFAQIQAAMTAVTGPDGQTDTVLQIGDGDTMTFRDVAPNQFQASNFMMPLDWSKIGALTFDDEFNSLSLFNAATGTGTWQTNLGGPANALFTYQPGGNNEQEVYTSAAFQGTSGGSLGLNPFSINNGVLTISATQLTVAQSNEAWGQSYSSGMLTTRGTFMQEYGYFEMRAELPEGAGSWPAFWLSQDPYNRSSEADIMEHLGMYPNTIFERGYFSNGVNELASWLENPTGYHTYGMLWTPSTTTFYIDGLAVMQTATPSSWNQPMYMLVNLAMGGWGGDIDTSVADTFNIDYIRVYGLADNSQINPTVMPSAFPTAQTYTAPAVVNSITVSGSAPQTVTGNNNGDLFYSNNDSNHLIGGTGNDKFYVGSGDTVTGGGGDDQYFFEAIPTTGATITDFNANDTIDMSAIMNRIGYTNWDSVAAGYVKVADDGKGDAQVFVDPDGPSGSAGWTLVFTLDGVAAGSLNVNGGYITIGSGSGSGGTGSGGQSVSTSAASYTAPAGVTSITLTGTSAQTVTGNSQGDVFHSTDNGNDLIGGTGADTFYVGRGGDVVTGGGGNDTFVFNQNPWSAYGQITDFNAGDTINLLPTLQRAGYASGDPVAEGYLKIGSDASGDAQVWFDPSPSGGGSWWLVTTLDGVASSTVAVNGGTITTSSTATGGGSTGGGSTGGGSTGGGSTGGGSTGGGTTTNGSSASTSDPTYTAPAGVTSITLTGTSAQTITGNNAGDTFYSTDNGNHLIGGTGVDTFYVGRGGDVVTGGGGDDTFVFNQNPWSASGHITDFAAGDTINLGPTLQKAGYSSGDAVAEGFVKIGSDASGNAQVWFDPSPTGGGSWWLVTTLDHVASSSLTVSGGLITEGGSSGGSSGSSVSTAAATYTAPAGVTSITLTGTSAQTVTGNNAGDTFNSTDNGNHLVGGTGADTFYVGRGGDIVTGGGGADTFVFNQNPWSAYGHITDFSTQDTMNLTPTLQKAGYTSGDPVAEGYVKFASDASGNAQVWFDPAPTGGGSWWLVATLDGVAAANLHANAGLITG